MSMEPTPASATGLPLLSDALKNDLIKQAAAGQQPGGSANDNTIRHEIDKLLRMAEEYQEKCDRNSQKVYAYLAVSATLAGSAISSLAFFVFASDYKYYQDGGAILFAAPVAVISGILGLLGPFLGSKTWKHYLRDRKALVAIADIVRELEPVLASMGKLSPLERAEIRVRLSRLDVVKGS